METASLKMVKNAIVERIVKITLVATGKHVSLRKVHCVMTSRMPAVINVILKMPVLYVGNQQTLATSLNSVQEYHPSVP